MSTNTWIIITIVIAMLSIYACNQTYVITPVVVDSNPIVDIIKEDAPSAKGITNPIKKIKKMSKKEFIDTYRKMENENFTREKMAQCIQMFKIHAEPDWNLEAMIREGVSQWSFFRKLAIKYAITDYMEELKVQV